MQITFKDYYFILFYFFAIICHQLYDVLTLKIKFSICAALDY